MKLNSSISNQRELALRRSVLISRPTESEMYVKDLLDSIKEDYCFQKGFFTANKHFIVDFYLKKRRKLCLEIDGGYHANPEQKEYDRRRDWFLENVRGFRVKRLTNEEALSLNCETLMNFLIA